MSCAWQAYLNLLPGWMREPVDRQGRGSLLELRLRTGLPPELILMNKTLNLDRIVIGDDIRFVINSASRYSPWTSATLSQGYLTGEGGHRIGVCGNVVSDKNGGITGIREPNSLNIRVARDFPGIAADIKHYNDSVLIIGKPGSGKTTLLRDYIRQRADNTGASVSVVDERSELFPMVHGQCCFPTGKRTDVLTGCSKSQGVNAVLRSMGPDTIAVDEITASEDCEALLHAGWCGVKLIATAHANSSADLNARPVYKPIIESGIFDTLVVLHPDKSWHMERIRI